MSSGDDVIGFATFFHHFWISYYKKTTKTQLYESFKKEFSENDNPLKYKKLLSQMEVASKYYMKVVSPNRSDYENRKEYYWLVQSLNVLSNYFNVVQVLIALLALYDLKENDLISSKDFKKTIIFLENFHFAYNAIMKNGPNKITSIYSTFSLVVRKGNNKNEVKHIIEDKLIKPLTNIYPSYLDFEANFVKLKYANKKGCPTNIVSKYVLNKLASNMDEQELFHDNGTVEHIIPETIEEHTLNIGN